MPVLYVYVISMTVLYIILILIINILIIYIYYNLTFELINNLKALIQISNFKFST